MDESPITQILERLASDEFEQAWADFLDLYSALIYQAVKLFEHQADPAADCFLFVCEGLSERQFRRLRSFKPGGRAQFTTWLRVVVRNLCLDWHRREFGRQRVFQSVARLGALDQDIFRCIFEQGLTHDESLHSLLPRHPQLTMASLDAGVERVRSALTDRQLWLAGSRQHSTVPLESDPDDRDGKSNPEPIDPSPGIEAILMMNQQQEALERALRGLAKPDRLLIKLRFERGLTLQEIASILGIKDAQTVDRRQREVVARLRQALTDFDPPRGKT